MAIVLTIVCCRVGAQTFRVATYNLEGYLESSTAHRTGKSPDSKAACHEQLLALRPDVVGLQEVGGTNALLELQGALASGGLALPYWELVRGPDTNIQVAVLSRFPIIARRPHTNESYVLSGRRFRVSRGFGEVDIRVNTNYVLTLINAHLKSKLTTPLADEAEQRLEEARLLREKVDAVLARDSQANLVVLGDLNDGPASASTRAVVGRGRNKLVDTRPAEPGGGPGTRRGTRDVAWTYYFAAGETYSRVDYILVSQGMAREWVTNETYVLARPNWGLGSDHRPLVATFEAEDK